MYGPALTDFVIMVDKTSQMFITGPDVIKTVTGEDVTMEELGGAQSHMTKSGTLHYTVASGEQDAFDFVRDLLSYLPPNNYAGTRVSPRRRTLVRSRTTSPTRTSNSTPDPGFAEPAVRTCTR